ADHRIRRRGVGARDLLELGGRGRRRGLGWRRRRLGRDGDGRRRRRGFHLELRDDGGRRRRLFQVRRRRRRRLGRWLFAIDGGLDVLQLLDDLAGGQRGDQAHGRQADDTGGQKRACQPGRIGLA